MSVYKTVVIQIDGQAQQSTKLPNKFRDGKAGDFDQHLIGVIIHAPEGKFVVVTTSSVAPTAASGASANPAPSASAASAASTAPAPASAPASASRAGSEPASAGSSRKRGVLRLAFLLYEHLGANGGDETVEVLLRTLKLMSDDYRGDWPENLVLQLDGASDNKVC